MALSEQIKRLRRVLDLTQQEFADRIGVKRNTVATYEMGRSIPSDAALSLICREFNVSEAWLRAGEGEMFAARSREDELSAAVNSILSGEDSEFRRRLIVALSRFSPGDWQRLERELRFILDGTEQAAPPVPAPDARNPHEYTREEFLEAMGQEWDMMKGAAPSDTGSGSSGTASA